MATTTDPNPNDIFYDKPQWPTRLVRSFPIRNGFEDQDGCPDTVPEAVKKFTGVVQGIFFDQNKATIRAQ